MPQSLIYTEEYTPDNLIAGGQKNLPTEQIVLKETEDRDRGTVLGRIDREVSATAPGAGNTGNGDFDDTPEMTGKTKNGNYEVILTAPTTFDVYDPDGHKLKSGSTGSAYENAQIEFQLDAGVTPFVAGDSFTITVSKPSDLLWVISEAANIDGSEVPRAILSSDTDATDEDTPTRAFFEGAFNIERVTLGTGHTIETIKDDLRLFGIYFRPVVKA